MHYVNAKSILSNKNGMNIYRGCTHGCIYCDSRSLCYNMNHEFTNIEVKENALILLEKALKSKKNKCMIGTGSMSDPYMPLEEKLNYTHNALELIYKYEFGATLITKSNKVLRDLELLKKINEQSKAVIQMTLTTYDEDICKILEPNVCTTKERFDTLNILKEENIPTIIWFSPFIPLVNDNIKNMEGLLNYAIKAKVKGIINFGIGLTLRDGNREYFYKKLKEIEDNINYNKKNNILYNKKYDVFLGLKDYYIKEYGTSYEISSEKNREIMDYFHKTCEKNNIMHNNDEIFKYLQKYESKTYQMSLF
ncbi:MAG: radical SAM protein [Eubacteriales bacterium]|nr:radical SAM protein [Eubacteriales bacterium]